MKKLMLLALLLLCLPSFSQTYIQKKTEDKFSAKDLTFMVTFDKRHLNADFAKGDPKAKGDMKNIDLGLRGCVGFDAQNAYQPEAGESLRYNVEGNADPHNGTIILWTAGMNYNPCDAKTDGKNRGNIALAYLMFDNDGRNIYYYLYEYANIVYFEWWSSEEPHGWGTYGRVSIARERIKKGQWHQLAGTWDDKRLMFYLNGEKISEVALPVKVSKTADVKAVNGDKSFIGIKAPFYDDNHRWNTAVDDVQIFSRALSPLEIQNQYVALLKDRSNAQLQAYSVTLNGIDLGHGDKIDRLEAEFDFCALDNGSQALLKAGKLEMDYELLEPDGVKRNGKWTFSQENECKILDNVTKVGVYTLNTKVGKDSVSQSIQRPDFSWVGNGLGDEDEVPALWADFAVKDRTVTLWNRVYKFGEGPLPEAITCYGGKELLTKAPKLLIDGKEPKWKAGKTRVEKRQVTYTGRGKLGNAKIEYSTKVEYDGFIQLNWTINGKPAINSMTLEWTMAPENHQFLMTPRVYEPKERKPAFLYPLTAAAPKMLWFVSENKGGFAYTMENDANWVYDSEKPVFFTDRDTGSCRVEMINRQVTLPEEVTYNALFIATPCRPLPKQNRVIRYGISDGHTPAMTNAGGTQEHEGFKCVFTHEPFEPEFTLKMTSRVPDTASVYGAIGALTTRDKEALYLKKYWEVPGAYNYTTGYYRPVGYRQYEHESHTSVSACECGCIIDYLLYGQNKLYHHPLADRIWQVYYDLCGDGYCSNKLHGCAFTDKFGRDIKSFRVLSVRKGVQRTVALAHKYGKTLMCHGQRDFLPMVQGMADYWYPGEQYNGLLINNPYGYVDDISDDIYRAEFNRNVIGIGIIHLPALGQANREYFRYDYFKYTEAMMAMMMLYDVDTCLDWAAGRPVNKCWKALKKYGVDAPETVCRRFYEQNEITSSNPGVQVTYYKCPGDKYVLILVNKDIRPAKTTIDLNQIASGDFTAQEEYTDTTIQVTGGRFDITVRPRMFKLIAFPPKPTYPILDNMDTQWNAWIDKKNNSEFTAANTGIDGSKCCKITHRDKPGGCFLKDFYIIPGKTYHIKVMAKHSLPDKEMSLSVNARKINGKVSYTVARKTAKNTTDWTALELDYTVPRTDDPIKYDSLQISLGGTGSNCTILFDDFSIQEK